MTSQERFNIIRDILEENDLPFCTSNIRQFDKISDMELIEGAKETVKKIRRYKEYTESNKIEYPENIMKCVRQNLGLDEMDASRDLEIYSMSRKEILNAVCTWNGLIEYGCTVAGWVEDIWQIKLDK